MILKPRLTQELVSDSPATAALLVGDRRRQAVSELESPESALNGSLRELHGLTDHRNAGTRMAVSVESRKALIYKKFGSIQIRKLGIIDHPVRIPVPAALVL